jgi:heavy metal sensor kinase
MTPLALKWRLTIPVAMAVAVAMAVICTLAYDNFSELVVAQTDRSLVSAGEAIRTVIDDQSLAADRSAHVQLVLAGMSKRPREKDSSDDEEQPQLLARVWMDNSNENIVATGSQTALHALTEKMRGMTNQVEGQPVSFEIASPDGPFRTVWLRVKFKGGPGNIVVAQSTGPLYAELHDLLWNLIVATLAVVVAVIVMSGMLIVLGLRPIRETAQRLAGITAGNIGQLDWPSDSVPAELRPFVSTVRQMLDRLDVAMRQQKTFIADAAHELRTPIAVAKSTMQVALAADRSNEEYRRALQDATDDLRRGERVVTELLTLARLEEAGGQTQFQELNLSQLLADLAESFHQRISAAGGKLVSELAPARIRGDAMQLQMLFSNLLDNALRHGPAHGEIRLALQKQESTIDVMVQDQGGNIAPADLPRLFDRFYRVDNARSQATGGTGLGLAIAKAIVLRHGGTIRIESSAASGTCVWVALPSLV